MIGEGRRKDAQLLAHMISGAFRAREVISSAAKMLLPSLCPSWKTLRKRSLSLRGTRRMRRMVPTTSDVSASTRTWTWIPKIRLSPGQVHLAQCHEGPNSGSIPKIRLSRGRVLLVQCHGSSKWTVSARSMGIQSARHPIISAIILPTPIPITVVLIINDLHGLHLLRATSK